MFLYREGGEEGKCYLWGRKVTGGMAGYRQRQKGGCRDGNQEQRRSLGTLPSGSTGHRLRYS
jgi:hypothetical protein